MKKAPKPGEVDEILPDIDFSKGVRGKYYERVMWGTNLVKHDPDGATFEEAFEGIKDAVACYVEALRELGKPIPDIGEFIGLDLPRRDNFVRSSK